MPRPTHLLLLILFCCSCSYRLSTYRIKTGDSKALPDDSKEITFLRPPGSRLRILETGQIATNRQFQIVTVHDLNEDYEHCLFQIGKARYKTASEKPASLAEPETKSYQNGAFYIRLKKDKKGKNDLEITIDYEVLWAQPELIREFDCFGGQLIAAMAEQFVPATKIPPMIAQSLVSKVFELIPYPVKSSAGRYGYSNNGSNFMLMFDEDLRLEMDSTVQVDDGVHAKHFEKAGTFPFEFHREDDGNVSQNPLAGSSTGATAPPNTYINANTYLISSFADIQNSSVLRADPFVVIFSPTMKRNSTDSRPSPYAPADDADPNTGNFSLIHLQQPAMSTFNFTATAADAFDNYTRSVFGLRNQGKVVFDIWVNHQRRTVSLGQRISSLRDLPAKIKVERMQYRQFRRVRGPLNQLFLLPGDQITFDL